ncbi:unnamed protein product [Bursaphelenchus okinawaensis]|uniref:Large ribosomal subunit protein uL10m n=1 Tax=Bursaphelenchus okinawaensis TaxID=465554 RepID=A0A811K8F9_9BILA|nr:unnamed protein product [Bursaphelenchus okinawaensis]CAG9094034.1 unnamed protein product [Bursaphelenchus okinawaensis]
MDLLNVSRLAVVQSRHVSSKYVKPHPRPFNRRLYEAALKPEMPEQVKEGCISNFEWQRRYEQHLYEYTPIEYALVDKVKEYIREEKFRVFSICQLLSTKQRPLHFTKNALRLKGLEYKTYPSRIMSKVFEGTPFDVLNSLYLDHYSCLLFGRDINAVKTIVTETKKIPYMYPLVITYDDKVLSLEQIEELSTVSDPDQLRAQTVQILQTIPQQLVSTLSHPAQHLTSLLSNIPK